MAVPDGPHQPPLPFDPPLPAESTDKRPALPELGADMLTARLFEEFTRRSARLDTHPTTKPPHAA